MEDNVNKIWKHRYKVGGTIAVFIVALFFFFGLHTNEVYAVSFNDEAIAFVTQKEAIEDALQTLKEKKSTKLGQAVEIKKNYEIQKQKSSSPVTSKEDLLKILDEEVNFITRGAAVKIDGEEKFYFKNDELADSFINKLKDKYSINSNGEVNIIQDVKIINEEVKVKSINSVKEALQLVVKGEAKQKIHVVEKNDTLWGIARNHNTTVEKIKELNPELSDILQLGAKVVISSTEPLLNVQCTYEINNEETIPFKTKYKMDSNLAVGKRQVIQQGKQGKKKVTYQVMAENGDVVGKESINEVVLQPAKPRIINKGTKLMFSSRSGGLIWPVTGPISSGFGMRWGKMHSGIDIAAQYGKSVCATAPGEVTRVEWLSGYGRLIEVNHGNGIRTRYAHLSAFGVNIGQKISQGQFLGKVGETGHATGPHLHFEIRINGVAKNPLNYL
ncbi:MAG: peptidoglycan DD-metalloendopeptidase family protein [Clostridiales bacterium]|nr:peptidoglycan DD-metalloendopeptidase family protein [Clostridiales bacterium]